MKQPRSPENWTRAKLVEVAKLRRGTEPGSRSYCSPPNGVRFLRVGDISGKSDNHVNTNSNNVVSCEKSDILMSFDGSPGIVKRGFEGAISSGIRIVEPDETRILKDYLYYYLQTEFVRKTLRKYSTGATIVHASKALPYIEVILPPLEMQRRIAMILERADELREMRRQARQLTDETIHSLFIDLFGHAATNSTKWKTQTIEEVCNEIYRYPTFYGFRYKPKGIPIVRIGDILDDGSLDEDISNYVFIDEETSNRFPRTILSFNDILMAVRGDGSTGKIGRVSTEKLVGANISPNLIRIQVNPQKINSLYLFGLLSSERGQVLIKSRITRTAKKKITALEFKAIEIPIPPMDLQERFARAFQLIEGMKRKQTASSGEINELFRSLMQSLQRGSKVDRRDNSELLNLRSM